MSTVVLDTVGMLALWDEAEQARAKFRDAKSAVVTTTYVLLECGNAAARCSYRRAGTLFRDVMIANGGLIVPNDDEWVEAWQAYDRGDAGQAGIVDQVSFVIMRADLAFARHSQTTATSMQPALKHCSKALYNERPGRTPPPIYPEVRTRRAEFGSTRLIQIIRPSSGHEGQLNENNR